jgi:glycosylphosphatidylinositol transamidase (GPIT) subunit GPI8
MNKLLTIISLLSLLSISTSSNLFKFENGTSPTNHYAVLVAGSNDYWNYRHQADVAHAYHLLLKNGIPKENIIVFAYDDIANYKHNPIRGKLFNAPSKNEDGDLYAGFEIDYKGQDVTPKNFLNVLLGNKEKLAGKGTGRVLESTSTDNVFIYFSDHGAVGLVAFPYKELYADELIDTLTKMHEKKSYKKLVFYLEACESGSMFKKILKPELNVYATTAANSHQSSYAFYCDEEAVVNGVNLETCLGDEYSIRWLEDSDKTDSSSKTLKEQFEYLKESVKESHVHMYGDKSFENDTIAQYQGIADGPKENNKKDRKERSAFGNFKHSVKKVYKTVNNYFKNLLGYETEKRNLAAVPNVMNVKKGKRISSRDVKKNYLYRAAKSSNDDDDWNAYNTEVKKNEITDHIFSHFDKAFNHKRNGLYIENINFICLRESVETFKAICNHWGEYELKYVRNIAAACETGTSPSEMAEFFRDICSGY